jgi:hypothetical protein
VTLVARKRHYRRDDSRAPGEIVVRLTGFARPPSDWMSLSAFSLPSFAGGIAGITSGLPLFFHGGFPRGALSEFRVAGLLLGLHGGRTSSSLGGLRSGQRCSLASFDGQLGGSSLSNTGIASHPYRLPCRSLLHSLRAIGRRSCSGRPLQLGLFRFCCCAQAVFKTGVLRPIQGKATSKGETTLLTMGG